MNTSVRWINDYLETPATAEEQADALTRAGLPLEHSEFIGAVEGGDYRQDIELTSNRGDCLCHIGLAREIAAQTGRSLKIPNPSPKATGTKVAVIKVTNQEHALCPLYTARVIRGVKVGESPAWLRDRLVARGDIPRNSIVDASNFVLFEFGQPTHVFDLATLHGSQVNIRKAHANELFLPIGENAAQIKLDQRDLVIADADRAVAIAGVKGGALTAVTSTTTDILIEAATFDAAAVRSTSRRLGIASDSSYRFERGVHPGQIEQTANRLAELILQLCGGTLLDGIVSDGAPIPPKRVVSMRCERCRKLLGIPISDEKMLDSLTRLEFVPRLKSGIIECTVPYPRLDIEREIDLIEEIARMVGTDSITIAPTVQVRVTPPQPRELARRAVNDALVGMGFIETVTHSLISEQAAQPFLAPGMSTMRVSDQRSGAEPVLRPSILPSLLQVMALNHNNGVSDVRLFETAATYAIIGGQHVERMNLALLQSATNLDEGYRSMRGTIERLVQMLLGSGAEIEVAPVDNVSWLAHGAGAVVPLKSQVLGLIGMVQPDVARHFGLNDSLIAAEIGLPAYYDHYPPVTQARSLPSFPAIERDLSIVIADALPWAEVKRAVLDLQLQHLETVQFITTFKGKQIEKAKKSLTLRARFRAADRTLRHEEVDPQMTMLMNELRSRHNADIRT
jgi:phenylalanyl-tRNA synthetase beta chain